MSDEQGREPTDEELDAAGDWMAEVARDETQVDRFNKQSEARSRWKAATPLRSAIGARVRAIREDADVRQEQLAEAARAVGLPWARSSVTTLEAGKRDLSVEEFALLPALLSRACGRTVTIGELLPVDADLRLGPRVAVSGGELREVLAGATIQPPESIDAATYVWRDKLPNVELASMRLRWPDLPLERVQVAFQRPTQEPDQKAARKLTASLGAAVTPRTVAVASEALWSRSIAEQRDALAAEVGLPESRRARQTALGHISRRLLAELEVELRAAEERATTSATTKETTDGLR